LLRNPQNLKRYSNICTVLSKEYFEAMVFTIFNEESVLLSCTEGMKVKLLSKCRRHDEIFHGDGPRQTAKSKANLPPEEEGPQKHI
jgi:hypothetical protein